MIFNYIMFILLLLSCTKVETPKQSLIIKGEPGHDILLFKIKKEDNKEKLVSYAKLLSETSINIEEGDYLAVSECNSFKFSHKLATKTEIYMSKLKINLSTSIQNRIEDGENVLVQCYEKIVGGTQNEWQNKTEFWFLPGKAEIFIALRKLSFDNPVNGISHNINLSSIKLKTISLAVNDKYFISPIGDLNLIKENVISANIGKKIWVLPGEYNIEVNGSQKQLNIERDTDIEITTGTLKIISAKQYSEEKRQKAGIKPIFIYLNTGVLLNLNTIYAILPGKYKLSLEGSDVVKDIEINTDELTEVKTKVVEISRPECFNKKCKINSNLTIHKDLKLYPIMTTSFDVPFLLFEDNYEYSIDTTRGILKKIIKGYDVIVKETLGRIKLKWTLKLASGRIRTDLVRIEALSGAYGRTLDLLYSKPSELYLPFGDYVLSYFVGDPMQERNKTRVSFHIGANETKELEIPLYMDKNLIKSSNENKNENKNEKISPNINSLQVIKK